MRTLKDILNSAYQSPAEDWPGFSQQPAFVNLLLRGSVLSDDEKREFITKCIAKVHSCCDPDTDLDILIQGTGLSEHLIKDAIYTYGAKYARTQNRSFELSQTLLCAASCFLEGSYDKANDNLGLCAWIIDTHFTDGRLNKRSFIEFQNNLIEEIFSR